LFLKGVDGYDEINKYNKTLWLAVWRIAAGG
jgi:hypothetical protein